MGCPKCGYSEHEPMEKEKDLFGSKDPMDRDDSLLAELMEVIEAKGVGSKLGDLEDAEPKMMSVEMLAAKPKKKKFEDDEEEDY